jgi:NAD(P)-dependent dehydrogenase (short-subunit alcohol dehydrogenase family)
VTGDERAGRVALVTGAGSGIGRATAIRLAADGHAVGCLDRNADTAASTAAEIRQAGGRAIGVGADVTEPAAVAAGVRQVVAELGPVAVLVNNAGVAGSGRFVDATFEAWRRVLDVHVDGTFHVTRAVLPGMLEAGWGRVVNIGSEAVWLGNTSVQYATAKAALVGFTRSLARQVARQGVLVNAVAPGPVETPMFFDNTPAEIEAERQTVLIGRLLVPDDIAATISFLVGPGGDAYVGQIISPNGGTVFPG